MEHSKIFVKLIDALKRMPGVGTRSAQRMAFYMLDKEPSVAKLISENITTCLENLKNCDKCNILTEDFICEICKSTKRDNKTVCVVESPSNVIAIENTGVYKGVYFVLKGVLSPIDGISPEDINIPKLEELIKKNAYEEIILALSSTVEGEATSYYISTIANNHGLKSSKIAHGIPMGGELEYIDAHTISTALTHRLNLNK